jgi:rare lipoprotein A
MKYPRLFGLIAAPIFAWLGTTLAAKAGSVCGKATYYDQGTVTANGENFNPNSMTVAHPWLPFGSWITIVDQDTGLKVNARVNDRGPWAGDFILDMTPVVINRLDPRRTSDIRQVCIYW